VAGERGGILGESATREGGVGFVFVGERERHDQKFCLTQVCTVERECCKEKCSCSDQGGGGGGVKGVPRSRGRG